jgi:hypothetical protein
MASTADVKRGRMPSVAVWSSSQLDAVVDERVGDEWRRDFPQDPCFRPQSIPVRMTIAMTVASQLLGFFVVAPMVGRSPGRRSNGC